MNRQKFPTRRPISGVNRAKMPLGRGGFVLRRHPLADRMPAEGKSLPVEHDRMLAEGKSLPAEHDRMPAEEKSLPAEDESVPAEVVRRLDEGVREPGV